MELKVTFSKFEGYGVWISKNNCIYACIALPHLKSCGIRFFDSKTKNMILEIPFDDSHFLGEMLCVRISACITSGSFYLFYADDKDIVDPYARGFSEDLSLCCVYPETPAFLCDAKPLMIPYEDSYFYLLNVRGATMDDASIKKDRGTFKALEKKITYYKDLGITALVLMPIYEVFDRDTKDFSLYREPVSKKSNYWGFGKGCHFAIKKSLVSTDDSNKEFQHFVNALHETGIECILMMQYEADCTEEYIIDSLIYWVFNFGIDGFRLIGPNIPVSRILREPALRNTKLIFENIGTDAFEQRKASKYKNIALINHDFENNARRLLKGDEDTVAFYSYSVRENSLYYAPIRFITDFSGFTLMDLVSYNVKHNEANNEDNTDGTYYNYSWNCGAEGDTTKLSINKLRRQQIRNAVLLYMLSQGTPALRGGDECLNSQEGNNNPYCQDNKIGWINYNKDKNSKQFYTFVKNLIAFRKRHSILHQNKPLMLFDYMSCKVPDVSFHSNEAFRMNQTPASREFGVLYYGDYAKQYTGHIEDSVYIIYNLNWEEREFALPLASEEKKWRILYSTDGTTDDSFDESKAVTLTQKIYKAAPRSISILLL